MLDKNFSSNTLAGCANQHYFESDGERVHTFLSFYKIFAGGEYNYSLTFSGTLDGSFRRISFANEACDSWEILSLSVARCKAFPKNTPIESITDPTALPIGDFTNLTFNGEKSKKAELGFFSTDPVSLYFDAGEYMCLKLCIKGNKIPSHPEVLIPIYENTGDGWQYTVNAPLPCRIGCDRPVSAKIGFFGDSITQGCGTEFNEYSHWNARLAELIGDKYSYWNLGIGYGKALDAATLGSWFSKARECDVIFLCFGVNDLNGDRSAEDIAASLEKVVDSLLECGCKIVLQTPPPFDYPPERAERWQSVCEYVLNTLCAKAIAVFDTREVLSLSEDSPEKAKFGGHPNSEGCKIWADSLYRRIGHLF